MQVQLELSVYISYLNGCSNEKIKFVCSAGFNFKLMIVNLSVFCDVAFTNQYDYCSTYGYLVFLYFNLIFWCSKTTPSVKFSLTDAKYYMLAEVTKEIIYLKQLLETLGLTVKTLILIYKNNQQAIDIANNLIIKLKTKHIDIKLHFIENWLKIRPFLLFITVPLYNMWMWWPSLSRESCMRDTQMFVFLDCIEVFIGWRGVLNATSNLIKINLITLKLSKHCHILLKHCNATTYLIVTCSHNLVYHK